MTSAGVFLPPGAVLRSNSPARRRSVRNTIYSHEQSELEATVAAVAEQLADEKRKAAEATDAHAKALRAAEAEAAAARQATANLAATSDSNQRAFDLTLASQQRVMAGAIENSDLEHKHALEEQQRYRGTRLIYYYYFIFFILGHFSRGSQHHPHPTRTV